ncbi:MAG: Stage V sporulation protein D [Lentisphaerae bacterium ADurb.Bin242]|nr:MAG: Stage V sporulation protein D [Lentisphaerae bacterium ADurb.Bin242]
MNSEVESKDLQILLRIMVTAFVIMLMLAMILIKLWNVQVISGREYNEKASRQYARNIRVPAVRGCIYSSDGQLLAGNRPCFEVLFHLSEMNLAGTRKKSVEHILQEVGRAERVLSRASGVTEEAVLNHMKYFPGIPMAVFKDLNQAELAKIAEVSPAIPGLELSAEATRYYPYGSLGAHLIGYTGPRDPTTDENRSEYFYYLPDSAGRSGVEKAFDEDLRGKPGKKLVIVNHRGFVHEVVGEPTPAEPASDIELTMDTRLQALSEKLLSNLNGAIVLLDAGDGSVLAMASSPGYDLNNFVPRISSRRYRYLLNQAGHPFVNKAAQGVYMPGSVIKPLIAISYLENGFSPDDIVDCDGATPFGSTSRIKCWSWRSGGHGPVSLVKAIEVSCNDFFIESGMKLGVDRISATMASAGIGSKTGFLLPENDGLLPSRDQWKNWTPYDTALISIGQGKILVSPLQAASYAAAIANGGLLWKPRLVRETRNPSTGEKKIFPSELKGKLAASPRTLSLVREGMSKAVNEPEGSAKRARVEGLEVCGKTGTAEVGSGNNRHKNTWFIGFVKTSSGRTYAVAVLVLRGESGGGTSAPLAARLFEKLEELEL